MNKWIAGLLMVAAVAVHGEKMPNILFVLVDDLLLQHLSLRDVVHDHLDEHVVLELDEIGVDIHKDEVAVPADHSPVEE